ncbi:MAG TPA: hypothetical protein PL044_02110 [Clostridiales bacterium]|nr:MAG: hypothetical protein BWY37_00445 [Firmicutes bacterium ADurb.Bin262]HOU11345.1 hypothetical protein [Clostridiales bacterium]HQK72562.1 hypothetical protein [Clostridiales bacterium]
MGSGTEFPKPAQGYERGDAAARRSLRRRRPLSATAVVLISTFFVVLILSLVALYVYYNPAEYPDIVLKIMPGWGCL